jgi:hypothetical protein
METITIKTLIDITNSGVHRPKINAEKEFNQHKNWITLLQCIGLRSIIEYDNDPTFELIDLKDSKFGKKYKGRHRVWSFSFRTDRSSPYATDLNALDLLIHDLHQVPILEKLEETINMSKAVFDLLDDSYRNTVVEIKTEVEEESNGGLI